jgi:peroxiredoxin
MVDIGELAPDFEGTDEAGVRMRLSELRGKRVLLHFFVLAWTGV